VLLAFEVEVTLRVTVSRPVHLGVLPHLEQVTRCHLSDNYFLYFSCRAPSLTRGRVCNLQCNDTSSISSYIATDGLSASSSWCRAPNGAHNQILYFCIVGGSHKSLTADNPLRTKCTLKDRMSSNKKTALECIVVGGAIL
jgi:hypothetical protein